MSQNPSSPLLEAEDRDSQEDSNTSIFSRGIRSLWPRKEDTSHQPTRSDESTPLLARDSIDDDGEYASDGLEGDDPSQPNGQRPSSSHSSKRSKRRIPTILALLALCLAVIAILGVGFAAPEAMQEYAEQAAVFKPTKLSIESFTADGINARIQGDFYFNSSRVERGTVRGIGRGLTWIARAAETRSTQVTVTLPEYDIELGKADIPPIVVSLKEMETTKIDVVVKVTPGDPKGLKQIASDWLEGRLGQLRLKGTADVPLKSGIFPLGTQTVAQILTFKDDEVPSVPEYTISKIKIHEVNLPDDTTGLSADVSISAYIEYPISFVVPPLAFEILVPGCSEDGPFILLANATSEAINIEPKTTVTVDASGTVRHLSERLVSACPDSNSSPLDTILGDYIHGNETTMYVRGSFNPRPDTPAWIAEIMQSIIVPVPFSGHSMDKLIRNFSMEDTSFSMPNPLADPNTPEAQPRISTDIVVLANIPEEMNFPIDVSRVRSLADVYYRGSKFGVLDLRRWQNASSSIVDGHNGSPRALAVHASIKDAPLSITDQDVFTDVIQKVLFGENLTLDVEAAVDIEITTALGTFAVREIPAEGKVPLKPLVGDGFFSGLSPEIGGIEITDTTPTILRLDAIVNITNPTNYSATVPYVNINLLYNDTIIANVSLEDLAIQPGRNVGMSIKIIWDPVGLSGENGTYMGRDLLSRYISHQNTSITLKTHDGTFPSAPWIGKALSNFEVKIPTPSLSKPRDPDDPGDGDGEEDRSHFIQDATMHLLSSTADFTLLSPFRHTTIYLTYINATALYNHTHPIGIITYDLPIELPPGATKTPRLPVDWSLGSVGYDAVKEALGGTLKLAAKANVSVRIDEWVQLVHFEGDGIGAHIQI